MFGDTKDIGYAPLPLPRPTGDDNVTMGSWVSGTPLGETPMGSGSTLMLGCHRMLGDADYHSFAGLASFDEVAVWNRRLRRFYYRDEIQYFTGGSSECMRILNTFIDQGGCK